MQEKLADFALSVLKVMLFLKAFIGKTFAIHPKSAKIVNLFSCVALICRLWYILDYG